ncbi:hypothetical protein B0H14DRAFT_3440636 [Mycena olivaceomarginata]|nr:hypothetical protein B0H14DRAFT_3440636 [Mycena olivaceomarginata]
MKYKEWMDVREKSFKVETIQAAWYKSGINVDASRLLPRLTSEIFTAAGYAPSISTSTQLHLPVGFPNVPMSEGGADDNVTAIFEGRVLAGENRTAQLQKKAKDDENRSQRLLASAEVIERRAELGREEMEFAGNIKSLKAPQLKDLAWSLELEENGTREVLIERILTHFGDDESLKVDKRYVELCRRRRGAAVSNDNVEQQAQPEDMLTDIQNVASGSGSSSLPSHIPPPPPPPNTPYVFPDTQWAPPNHLPTTIALPIHLHLLSFTATHHPTTTLCATLTIPPFSVISLRLSTVFTLRHAVCTTSYRNPTTTPYAITIFFIQDMPALRSKLSCCVMLFNPNCRMLGSSATMTTFLQGWVKV